jgi:acetyltransferase-like isoleucine patch superfamily enzyme
MNLRSLYTVCKKSGASYLGVLLRFIYYKTRKKQILAHQRTIIKGIKNIETQGSLWIGIGYFGFVHKKDITWLNIQGKCIIRGHVSIGRGCRFDIGKNATVEIGKNSCINPFTKLIIQHHLVIGENCSISWDCQFLDEDFHTLAYENRNDIIDNKIIIGNQVWIGNNVFIYKGVAVGKNSVIASNSVVKGKFNEENVLIAGNPARIVRRNVFWT